MVSYKIFSRHKNHLHIYILIDRQMTVIQQETAKAFKDFTEEGFFFLENRERASEEKTDGDR